LLLPPIHLRGSGGFLQILTLLLEFVGYLPQTAALIQHPAGAAEDDFPILVTHRLISF
jgi:hypothetical protein